MTSRTRREFLQACSGVAAAAFATSVLCAAATEADPARRPIGIQLYSVRQAMASDTPGTLKQLHDIGYREVETADLGSYSAKDFGRLIKDASLSCHSAHLEFDTTDMNVLFENALAVGATYATSSELSILGWVPGQTSAPGPGDAPATPANSWPGLPIGTDGFKRLASYMNTLGVKAKAAGLQYVYHNHSKEFEKLPDGRLGYDILINETDPQLVKFEIDCGWMAIGGASPAEYMMKYPSRFCLLHIKDFKAMPTTPGIRPPGCDLGAGFVQYKSTFAAAKAIGIQHILSEQERPFTEPEMESAKIDYAYIRSFT